MRQRSWTCNHCGRQFADGKFAWGHFNYFEDYGICPDDPVEECWTEEGDFKGDHRSQAAITADIAEVFLADSNRGIRFYGDARGVGRNGEDKCDSDGLTVVPVTSEFRLRSNRKLLGLDYERASRRWLAENGAPEFGKYLRRARSDFSVALESSYDLSPTVSVTKVRRHRVPLIYRLVEQAMVMAETNTALPLLTNRWPKGCLREWKNILCSVPGSSRYEQSNIGDPCRLVKLLARQKRQELRRVFVASWPERRNVFNSVRAERRFLLEAKPSVSEWRYHTSQIHTAREMLATGAPIVEVVRVARIHKSSVYGLRKQLAAEKSLGEL